MVRSIVRNYHWPPDVFGGLFIDAMDHNGLVYWYNDIKAQEPPAKKK
jgi:hypothetical protein